MLKDVICVKCLPLTFRWFRKRCMTLYIVCMCVSVILHVCLCMNACVIACECMCENNSVKERANEMKS